MSDIIINFIESTCSSLSTDDSPIVGASGQITQIFNYVPDTSIGAYHTIYDPVDINSKYASKIYIFYDDNKVYGFSFNDNYEEIYGSKSSKEAIIDKLNYKIKKIYFGIVENRIKSLQFELSHLYKNEIIKTPIYGSNSGTIYSCGNDDCLDNPIPPLGASSFNYKIIISYTYDLTGFVIYYNYSISCYSTQPVNKQTPNFGIPDYSRQYTINLRELSKIIVYYEADRVYDILFFYSTGYSVSVGSTNVNQYVKNYAIDLTNKKVIGIDVRSGDWVDAIRIKTLQDNTGKVMTTEFLGGSGGILHICNSQSCDGEPVPSNYFNFYIQYIIISGSWNPSQQYIHSIKLGYQYTLCN